MTVPPVSLAWGHPHSTTAFAEPAGSSEQRVSPQACSRLLLVRASVLGSSDCSRIAPDGGIAPRAPSSLRSASCAGPRTIRPMVSRNQDDNKPARGHGRLLQRRLWPRRHCYFSQPVLPRVLRLHLQHERLQDEDESRRRCCSSRTARKAALSWLEALPGLRSPLLSSRQE